MKRLVMLASGAAICLLPSYGLAQGWLSLNPQETAGPVVSLDAAPSATEAAAASAENFPVALLDASATTDGANAGAPEVGDTSKKWRLTFELPLWLAGISGSAGVHGFSANVDASFADILGKTDSIIGLGGRVEAGYGPWTLVADGVYMKLTASASKGPASIDMKTELAVLDVYLIYLLGPWNLGDAKTVTVNTPSLSLDVGPGVRYFHVGLQLNTVSGLAREQNADSFALLAATQIFLNLDRHWQIVTRADVGGGTHGAFTWSAAMLFRYRFLFTREVGGAVEIGYKAVGEDFHKGSGRDEFSWDAIMHGPVIGFAVDF